MNIIVVGRDFATEMKAMFEKDIEESNQIRLEHWKKRPLIERIRESIMRLFQYWL